MDNNIEMLNDVYQNSQMGQLAIEQLVKATEDPHFLTHLNTQLEEYNKINSDAKRILHERGYEEQDLNKMTKLSSNLSINMKTMMDSSPSHLAEMMLQGSTMGIIDMTKKINNDTSSDPEVLGLAKKLLRTEESNVEHLKEFLS